MYNVFTLLQNEDEVAYRNLRAVSNLLLESIPHAILQTVLLFRFGGGGSNSGSNNNDFDLNVSDVVISLVASILNVFVNMYSIWRQSRANSMTFLEYGLVSLQGKFGFVPRLPAIEKGLVKRVDWTKFKFGHESAGMFAEAVSNENCVLKTIIIKRNTIQNISMNSIRFLVAACQLQKINVVFNETLKMKNWEGKYVKTLHAPFVMFFFCFCLFVFYKI